MRTHRRTMLLAGAVSLTLVPLLAGCSGDASEEPGSGGDSEPLTLVTWGGTTEEGYRTALADPFTEETGIPTEMVNPVDYGKFAAQIETDQVTWDWVDTEGWFNVQNPDWWAPIDTDVVQIDEEDTIVLPGREDEDYDWGIPGGSYSFVIAYRTDTDLETPTTWEEFFDTENFPGKRAVYNYPYGMLEVALLADGVSYEDLYPLDMDRALAKLDTVRDDLIFWNSGAELQQLMSSGEADFSFAWNNRIAALAQQGEAVDIEWGENLQDGGFDVTPKNNPQVEETMQLFAKSMEQDVQVKIAEATGYSPSSKSALEALPEDLQPWYNAYPENLDQAVGSINLEWWAENFDAAVEEWSSWAGQ